jgi:hypothetical protein
MKKVILRPRTPISAHEPTRTQSFIANITGVRDLTQTLNNAKYIVIVVAL